MIKSRIYQLLTIGFLCAMGMTVQAQEIGAQLNQGSGTREVFNQRLLEIEQELATLNDKYMGPNSVFIPLETYVQEAKDCANQGRNLGRGLVLVGAGLGCSANSLVITDAIVRNTGNCPSGWITRGVGPFDGGYHFFGGGDERDYAFCVK